MRSFIKRSLLYGLLVSSLSFSSCVVGPDYLAPGFPTSDQWHYALKKELVQEVTPLETWWQSFNDPALTELILLASASNKDLKIALEKVEEARALQGVAASAYYPRIDGIGNYDYSRSSQRLGSPTNANNPSERFSWGFDSSWEVDLFGKVRRSVESSQANQEAAVEFSRDIMVSLYAEIALNYIQLRTSEKRSRLAQANVAVQQESNRVTQARFKAGLVPRIDMTQALTNLNNTKAIVPLLEQEAAFARNRLSVLLGEYPGNIDSLLKGDHDIPLPSQTLSVGLPAELIRRRPDIREAERNLAAQTARIGVVQAELYPQLSLNGSFQLQASDAGNLFDLAARAWGLNPTFRWNLFNAGEIRKRVESEESLARQALLSYENTVLIAVEEVENSLVAIATERKRHELLKKAADSTAKTVSLVKQNYKSGLVSFQNVLDAERSLTLDQDEEAQSLGQVSINHVQLFKALGGGVTYPDSSN
ncbi:MAG: efflux transporter outer membrane subunit [Verrucomicrobiota bacterium]